MYYKYGGGAGIENKNNVTIASIDGKRLVATIFRWLKARKSKIAYSTLHN